MSEENKTTEQSAQPEPTIKQEFIAETDRIAEQTKIAIRFKATLNTPRAEVARPGFMRVFKREEEPFLVSLDEWEMHLKTTNLFEPVPPVKTPPASGAQHQAPATKQ
jgi:hypothetical protein